MVCAWIAIQPIRFVLPPSIGRGLIRANDPKGVYRSRHDRVVSIAITVEAFDAITSTLPLARTRSTSKARD
jgi:hypothetical protein